MLDTSTFFTEFKIKEQRYPSYIENNDYQLLNSKTAKDDVERELYKRMVKAAVKINRIFPSVRGMTDAVCVVGASKNQNNEMTVDDKGTWVTCLFDIGAEAGTHTQVEQIGIQKGHTKAYINKVAFLLGMPPKLKKHFMKQCSDNQKEI